MFLLKPHVIGAENQITSPDVIVDHVVLDGSPVSTRLLTHECWQQGEKDMLGRPAYAIMALGGGALILPATVLSNGLLIVSRQAWRLRNLDGHVAQITLNNVPLSAVGLPADLIASAGGSGDLLPRGMLVAKSGAETALTATLTDPVLERSLSHRVHVEALDADRWNGRRPEPRYSVGPTQKDVQHYI